MTITVTAMTTQKIQLAIRASADQVWQALTDGDVTERYYVGFRAEFDLTEGADYRYTAGGADKIIGTVLAVEPGHLLRTSFRGLWNVPTAALPESVVTFRIDEPVMPMPGVVVLSCMHEGLPATPAAADLEPGWVAILSSLKTLLETGRSLTGPAGA